MSDWLAKITAWLVGLVTAVFTQLVTWIRDAVLWGFDGVLQAFAGLVAAIPVPAFLSTGIDATSSLSVMPAFTLYVLGQLGIPACMAVISAGVTFRLIRKAVTVGQW